MKTATGSQIALGQEDARLERILAREARRLEIDFDVYLRLQKASLDLPEEDRAQYLAACERLIATEPEVVFPRFSGGFELIGD